MAMEDLLNLAPEDLDYFLKRFGALEKEAARIAPYFDRRPAVVKRREFNAICAQTKAELLQRYGPTCMLGYPGRCDPASGWEVDHLIPLQSNVLNKQLRRIQRVPPKKVPSRSYGSNKPCNLIIACRRCNGHKKNRFLEKEHLLAVLARIAAAEESAA